MISAGELYYLNRALDGKTIFGINPIESLISSQESKESPKESLIKKNILKDDDGLNEESFKIINNLEKYKNAKGYIWVNDSVLSLDKTDYLVLLKNLKKGQYIFERTTKAIMLHMLIKNHKFLCGNIPVENKSERIDVEEFISNKLLKNNCEEVLFIQKGKEERISVCNTYYKQGNLYKYDALKKELTRINPRDIRLELAKIFEFEVNQ